MGKMIIILLLSCVLISSYPVDNKRNKIKIGYIYKMGDHPWFVREIEGAKRRATELGIELETQDVQLDVMLTLKAMDRMIASGVQGIAIVIPNKKLGPLVMQKAKDANIPLVAVDDEIIDEDGNSAPYIGTDGHLLGRQVGSEIARIFQAENFAKHKNKVKVISIDDPNIAVAMLRSKGAEKAFTEHLPNFPKENILHIPYNNTKDSAKLIMIPTIAANEHVTHWVIWSANDSGVLEAIQALEEAGFGPEQIIGVGIGGARSHDVFNSPQKSGFRATVWIDATVTGATAVNLLYDKIVNGKEIPAKSFLKGTLVSPENFSTYKSLLKN